MQPKAWTRFFQKWSVSQGTDCNDYSWLYSRGIPSSSLWTVSIWTFHEYGSCKSKKPFSVCNLLELYHRCSIFYSTQDILELAHTGETNSLLFDFMIKTAFNLLYYLIGLIYFDCSKVLSSCIWIMSIPR